jgi:hypothetical protein
VTATAPEERRHGEERRRELLTGSWSFEALGFTAGAIGALVVALFFLVVDILAGRPLWTPTALGSALFLGKHIAPDAGPIHNLVLGYTAIHLGVFAGIGAMTTAFLEAHRRGRGLRSFLGIGLALFGLFELVFGGFALLFSPSLMGELGAWRVAAANALAAAVMALYVVALAGRIRVETGVKG